MALNFPDNPTTGQLYTDSTAGFTYEWDGVVWKSYTAAASKNISIVDNIESSFNGSTQTFTLAVSGTSFTPANAQQLRVVLGGIVQEPLTDYTVSGSNITFTTPPTGGLDCSIVSLGPAVPLNVPGDGTVTPVKLSTGGPSWNTSGDVNVSGVITATTFSGNATTADYATTAGIATNAQGLSGSPSISVTNINATGIITATGFSTSTGTSSQFLKADGSVDGNTYLTSESQTLDNVLTQGNSTTKGMSVGLTTFSSGAYFNKILAEEVNITAGKLSDNTNIDLENGMVHYFTTTETTTSTPNIRYSASQSLNSVMTVGQTISVTLFTTTAAAAYSAQLTIDGGAVTENWIGGSAPTAGGSSGIDIYSYSIIKTGSATFTVIANLTNAA